MIECRGRNGWFIFSKFATFLTTKYSYVSIYSKRQPKLAPIYFTGPPDEMIKLFENILSELKSQNK